MAEDDLFIPQSQRFLGFGTLDDLRPAERQPNPTPDFFTEVIPAAFELENTAVNFYRWLTAPNFEDEAGFDAFSAENIAGYELDAMAFMDSESVAEQQFIKDQLDRERASRAITARAGPAGMVALLVGTVFDPLTMLPVGGGLTQAMKAGNVLKTGLLTARNAAIGATAAEGILHANQVDRDLGESAFAIGGATFLGGIMGSAIGALSKGALAKAAAEVEADLAGSAKKAIDPPDALTPDPRFEFTGGVGEEDLRVGQRVFDEQDAEVFTGGPTPVELEIQKVTGLKSTSKLLGPFLRTQIRAHSAVVRSVAQQMTENPYRTVANVLGRVSRTRVVRDEPVIEYVGTRGTIALKGDKVDVKGIVDGSEVEIIGEPSPTSFLVSVEVERKVQATRVHVEGQPTVIKVEAPKKGKSVKPAKRLAGKADVAEAEAAATARITRELLESDVIEELENRGFTGIEGVGKFAPPLRYDVMDVDGQVLGSHATKADANAQADAGFVKGMKGDLDGQEVSIIAREGDKYVVRGRKGVKISRQKVKTDLEVAEFTPRVENVEGVDDLALPVSTRVLQWTRNLGESLVRTDELFTQYRLRMAGKPDTFANRMRIRAQDLRFASRVPDQLRLTRLHFRQEVGAAMRSADQHAIPEVQEAAQHWRDTVFEPLRERAIEAGILEKGISATEDTSYLTRVYNLQKIIDNPEAFDNKIKQWLRSKDVRPDLNPSELVIASKSIRDAITGAPGGRIIYEPHEVLGIRATMKRTLNIPDRMIEEFLENDIELVGSMYVKTVAPDAEIARQFGDVNMTIPLEDIARDYDIKERALMLRTDLDLDTRAKANHALRDERALMIDDIEAMRDRERGTFKMPENPNAWGWRFTRGARAMNLLAQGGEFMISSWSDIMRPVMVHGLGRTLGDGVLPLIRSFKDPAFRKMALDELRDAMIGWEMVLDSRALSMFDIGQERITRGNSFEQLLHGAADNMSQLTLLSQWNRSMKQFSGIVTQARMLRAMESVAKDPDHTRRVIAAMQKGGARKVAKADRKFAKEISKLAEQGIDADTAIRMHGHFQRHGRSEQGFFIANADDWGRGLDDEARVQAQFDARLFQGKTLEEVNKIIVTPGVGDRPKWMSHELGKSVTQYKSFALAATGRVLISGLQQKDMAALNGAFLSVGMGMAVAGFKGHLAGRGDEVAEWTIPKWLTEGADRSGMFGVYSEGHGLMEKLNLGASRFTGQPHSSRFAARNILEAYAGPTVGATRTIAEVVSSAALGDVTTGDVNKVRRMWPYNQVFWTRRMFDAAEKGINRVFDVPETSSR